LKNLLKNKKFSRKSWKENCVGSPPEKGELEGVTWSIILLFSTMYKKIEKKQTIWREICGLCSGEKI
jgi:hypothetical protein